MPDGKINPYLSRVRSEIKKLAKMVWTSNVCIRHPAFGSWSNFAALCTQRLLCTAMTDCTNLGLMGGNFTMKIVTMKSLFNKEN